jgi:hypothetical protein
MFHAISAYLGRLALRISAGQPSTRTMAVRQGWEARRVGFGTWEYRDPRFDALTPRPISHYQQETR